MRKLFIGCLAALSFPLSILAQEKTQWVVFGGPQASTARYKIDEVTQPTDFKYGAQVGFGSKIFFDKNLYFAPAMYYGTKGYTVMYNRFSPSPGTDVIKNDLRVHTLELALLLQYDFKKEGAESFFFLRFGPSFDIHLAGTENLTIKNGNTYEKKQAMPFSFVRYGRLGMVANPQVGYHAFNGWEFVAKYGLGMSDMDNLDKGPKINHRTLAFTIGKYLGK